METVLNKNITKPRLFKLLSIIAECRYISFDILKTVKNPITNYVASKSGIEALLKADMLREGENNSLVITSKSLDLLKKDGRITEHIQERKRGEYNSHQQKLTATLYPVMWSDDFYHAFYPVFRNGWLWPDACVICKDDDNNHHIEFWEVENTEKGPDYLKEKSDKYQELASDYGVYDEWWRKWAAVFRLPFCDPDQFRFSVRCYGNRQENTIFKFS